MSQLTDNLSAIAAIKSDIRAAIESKGVSMSGVSFGSYAAKIGEIETGGTFVTEPLNVTDNGTYTPGQGVDGYSQVTVNVPQSVTGFTEKDVTEGIQIVNLSNSASFVASYAFTNNSYLQTVNLPNCTVVNTSAFDGCNNLQTVNLSVCSGLYTYAFNNCKLLSSFYGPSVSLIGQRCFEGCEVLNSVYIPLCSQIDISAFRSCFGLTSIDLPNVVVLGTSVFMNCKNLSYINIPKISSVKTGLFQNCTSLTTVMIGSMSSDVIPLGNLNAFTGTPIAAGTGSIYVPSSLLDAYKSATNWSVYSSQIFPISE